MERRAFLGAAALCLLLATPLAAEAQQAGKVYRVGMIFTAPLDGSMYLVDAFRQGLRELGWIEGKNIKLELRTADGEERGGLGCSPSRTSRLLTETQYRAEHIEPSRMHKAQRVSAFEVSMDS